MGRRAGVFKANEVNEEDSMQERSTHRRRGAGGRRQDYSKLTQ